MFGAGCFWGVEHAFRQIDGVREATSGYSGGHSEDPTYRQVCTGTTGHAEVVLVEFDPRVVSFSDLLNRFWSLHDPTTLNRQGPDVGSQYRSAIFTFSDDQMEAAEHSRRKQQEQLSSPIVTEIKPASIFYPAEEYHQRYLEKNGQAACPI